jgi:SAM-dependent methyltransferase
MNEWSTIEVCESHGYDKNVSESCEHHDEFVEFLEEHNIESPAILDIGCCNGRVLNSFISSEKNLGRYHGVDINEHAIDIAKNHWKDRDNVSFELFDVEEEDLNILSLNEYDVVYIDSVLTMLSGWKNILNAILDAKVPIVYLNRTQWITNIYLDCDNNRLGVVHPSVELSMIHSWGGMKEMHIGQYINEAYLKELADDYDLVVVKYKKDDIDGNWFDFYAWGGDWHCPFLQQEIREGTISIGDIIENTVEEIMKKQPNERRGLNTGRGVWFTRKGKPNELCNGMMTDYGSSSDCALTQLRNRKVIFISKDSEVSSSYIKRERVK